MNAELFGTSLESFAGALTEFEKVLSGASPIPEKKISVTYTCVNCGAPIKSKHCEYCGTKYRWGKMFVSLRFIVACASLVGMAICPSEWEIISKIGLSILLLLYEIEDIAKTIKDIKRIMEVDKNG